MAEVEVGVLGTLQLKVGGNERDLSPLTARLLAVLVAANEPLPRERLIEEMWPDPPASAAESLRVHIHGLRRHLGPGRIDRTSNGYQIRLEASEVDAERFKMLAAAGAWSEAEMLWRGRAYEGHHASEVVATAAAQLDEQRLEVVQHRLRSDVDAGRRGLIPELRKWTHQHPFREALWECLILALYNEGRQTEALRAYGEVRLMLASELGLKPGPALKATERHILGNNHPGHTDSTGHHSPQRAAETAAELPPDRPLVGRQEDLRRLVKTLAIGEQTVATVSGPGGIGKSALTVHACHQIADQFPDGQLYVDLRGSTPDVPPLKPVEALDHMLRSLGAAVRPGGTEDERVGLFRSVTRNGRLLILLDNAADAHQVASLIPNGRGCAVAVTARRPLTTMSAALHLRLGSLSPESAHELLEAAAGPERVTAESDEIDRLVSSCGGLGLALQITGSRLALFPDRPLSAFADRLADPQRTLDELTNQDLSVRRSINASCQQLRLQPAGHDAVSLFAYLGLWDGVDIASSAAASLAGWSQRRTDTALDSLADAQLVQTASNGHYGMHDLVRLYSKELADETFSGPERLRATERLFSYFYENAWESARLLNPAIDSTTGLVGPSAGEDDVCDASSAKQALAWVREERHNLLVAARQATSEGHLSLVVSMAAALMLAFKMHGWYEDLAELGRQAVTAAENREYGAEPSELAEALLCLGQAEVTLGRVSDSIGHLEKALAITRPAGQSIRNVATLVELARAHATNRDLQRSMECFEKASCQAKALSHKPGQNMVLLYKSLLYLRVGKTDGAQECLGQVLAGDRSSERARGAAFVLLGASHRRSDPQQSRQLMEQGLSVLQRCNEYYLQAHAFWALGKPSVDREENADGEYERAVDLLVELGVLTVQQAGSVLEDPEAIASLLPMFVVV